MIHLRSYTDALPVEIPQKAYIGAFYSFVVSAVLSRDLRLGLVSGLLAGTASIVGSLLMPLIGRHFSAGQKKGHISWRVMTTFQIAGLGVMHFLLRQFTAYHINFFASAFFTLLAINISLDHEMQHSRKHALNFIVVM